MINKEYSKNFKIIGIMTGIGVLMMFLNISCLSRFFFHLPCPFCGTSRAFMSLLKFDFKTAFYFHPLFFLTPIYLWLFVDYINYKRQGKLLAMLTILYLIVFLVRVFTVSIP